MKDNSTVIASLKRKKRNRLQGMGTMFLFVLLFSSLSWAQDSNVPSNVVPQTNTAWVQNTYPVSISGTNGTWTNPANVTNSSLTDYASTSVGSTFGSSFTNRSIKVLDGTNTYGTTPFTGYWVGFKLSRTGLWTAVNSSFTAVITTYLNGTVQETSSSLAYNDNMGFYAHLDFDEIQISFSGNFTGGSPEIRVWNVELRRYTRTQPCNTPSPLVGPGLNATTAGLGLWTGTSNLEDNDPSTHANFTTVLISGAYTISLRDEAVIYPTGTYGGIRLTTASAFAANLINLGTLTLLKDGTPVTVVTGASLFSGSLLSSDGAVTVGAVATGEFNEIQYTVLSPGFGVINTIEVSYPVITNFCDNDLACNTPTKMTQGDGTNLNHPVYVTTNLAAIGCLQCSIESPDNAVDTDPDNYAYMSQAVTGLSSYYVGVKSRQTGGYPAGTFAGLEIEDVYLASGGAGIGHSISTYLNGVLQETYDDGGGLAATKFFVSTGRHVVGFKSEKPFDEIRLTINSAFSAGIYGTRIYGAVFEKFCSTGTPACNTNTPLVRSTFPAFIDGRHTGVNDLTSINNYIENPDNVTDALTSNYASINLVGSATVTATLAVQDGAAVTVGATPTYPSGTFAGFDISNNQLVGVNSLSGVTVSTLNEKGEVLQTVNASGGLISLNSSLITGTQRQVIGFVANQPFTGVRISFAQGPGLSLGTIRIYSAIIKKFCVNQELVCRQLTPVTNPDYPVYIDGKETGFFGVASAGNAINNSENAIDNDTDSYAGITLGATLGASASFAIANAVETYPASTYAGFDIGSASLFNAGILSSMSIQLLNNGLVVQNSAGTALLGGVTSSLVTGGYQRQVIGVVGHVPFDEVKITFANGAAVDLGMIRIYGAVFQPFLDESGTQICTEVIDCQSTYVLTNSTSGGKNTSAVVNFERTGTTGALAAGYGVENPWNVVSASTTDFATLHNAASGANTVSLSVAAPGVVYPKGTFAGFTIKKNSFPVSGSIFPNITVSTYLNGVFQESNPTGALVDLTVVLQWFGTPTDFYNPGFKTTKPFNEVRITVSSLVGALQQYVDVYGAYVDTRESAPEPGDGSTPIACAPDLTPTITVIPSSIVGSAAITLRIRVTELKDKPTSGAITLNIRRSSDWTIGITPGTVVNGWTYNGLVGIQHQFISSAVLSNSYSQFNVPATFNPSGANGKYTFTVTIPTGSAGESPDTNNTDQEAISYEP